MTARAQNLPPRRGACPGLAAPMATGDGLLVRLTPAGTIPLAAFAELCAAAREHGNGVIEITSRGNIQVRGLSPASAAQFAARIAALSIAAQDGVPILCNALAGLDAEEILDAAALAGELRRALARHPMAARLGPKVSVVIDGGGALPLDRHAADLRLRAETADGGAVLHVGVGGDAAAATELGCVAPAHGVAAAMRVLEILARRGPDARAHSIIATDGAAVFHSALAGLFLPSGRPSQSDGTIETQQKSGEPIGMYRLRDGGFACGIGLAFGHADAAALERLSETAAAAGANGMRAAAGRALMTIGLAPQQASTFLAAAERLGLIVRADDARRHVVACAGAPVCASAHIAARALAPQIAAAAAPHIDGSFTIHISGCAKGCAHPAPAALTVVGAPHGCALVANGSARDAPFAAIETDDLPAAIAGAARRLKREGGHV